MRSSGAQFLLMFVPEHCKQLDAEQWSNWMASLPATIEPGSLHDDYRAASAHFQRMEKQQLLLYLDELIERHVELLSDTKIQFEMDDDRVDWDDWEIDLQPKVGGPSVASLRDAIEMIVVEIVLLFQRFETPATVEMIADLVSGFGRLGWTPDTMNEVLPYLAETLGIAEYSDASGISDHAGAWIARHRSHRQAMRLAEATAQAPAAPARQRL